MFQRPASSAGRRPKRESSVKDNQDQDDDNGGRDGDKSKLRPMTGTGRRSSRVSDDRADEHLERLPSEKQKEKSRPKTGERRRSSKPQAQAERSDEEDEQDEVPMRKQKSEKSIRPKTSIPGRRSSSRGAEDDHHGSADFDAGEQRPRTGIRKTKSKTAESSREDMDRYSEAQDDSGQWPVHKHREGRSSSRKHKDKESSESMVLNAESWGDVQEDDMGPPSSKEMSINNWVEGTVMDLAHNSIPGRTSSARRDNYHPPNGIAEEEEDDPDADFRMKTVPASRRSASASGKSSGGGKLEPGAVLMPRGLDLDAGMGHGHGVPPRPPGAAKSPLHANAHWRSPFLNELGSGAPSMDDTSSMGAGSIDSRPATAAAGKVRSSSGRRKSSIEPGDVQVLQSRSGRREEIGEVMLVESSGSSLRPQTADPSAVRRQKQQATKQSPAKKSVVPRSNTEPDDEYPESSRRSGDEGRYREEDDDDEEPATPEFGWGTGGDAKADVFVLGDSGDDGEESIDGDGEQVGGRGHGQVVLMEVEEDRASRRSRNSKAGKGLEYLDEEERQRLQREEEVDRQWEEEGGDGDRYAMRRRSSDKDKGSRRSEYAAENEELRAELEHIQKKYNRATRKLREAEEDNARLKEQYKKEKAERKRLQEEVKRLTHDLRDSHEKRRVDNERRKAEKEELVAQVAALKLPHQLSPSESRDTEPEVVVNGTERKSPRLGILSALVRPRTPEKERKEKTPEKERTGLGMIHIQRPVTPEGMSARLTRKNREVIRAGRSKEKAEKSVSHTSSVDDHSDSLNILGRPFVDVRDVYKVDKNELGRGRFGVIRACVHRGSGRRYACKTISKTLLQCSQDVDDVRREVAVMELLRGHPNVASLEAVFEDQEDVHLVMEMCEGGELFDRIKGKGRYSEPDSATIMNTVVRVLQHCHALGVMHRDLKPENILLLSRESDTDLKVIDYGVACFFQKGKYCTDMAGSPYYLAPEVLAEKYGPEADIWSAGVVLYILLSGLPPFWATTNEGIFEAIKEGSLNMIRPPWPTISEEAKDLVRRMLTRNPKKRISLDAILCHPWIQAYAR